MTLSRMLWISAIPIFSISCGLLANPSRDIPLPAASIPVPSLTEYDPPSPEPSISPEPIIQPSQTTSFVVIPTPAYSIRSDLLIDECYPPEPGDDPIPGRFEPCSGFTVSENKQYLGYYFGPASCGRGMQILDLETGDPSYFTEFGGLNFEFLSNGKVLITTGHCEGGRVELLDPKTGELTPLGGLGIGDLNNLWNETGSALVVNTNPYHGFESAIWGYNVTEDFIFLPQPEDWQRDDGPRWVPGGTHLLFQHRELITDEQGTIYQLTSGKQIKRVDATTGEQTTLLADPSYDYHLCSGHTADCTRRWHGDWIQVLRLPFNPLQITYTIEGDLGMECIFYGFDCDISPELYALNWRTGEMIPWAESSLPTPIPRPTPTEGGEFG